MDPNATLTELRDLIDEYYEDGPTDRLTRLLVDHFQALDNWIKGGGFLPDDWDWSKIAGERFYA